MSGLRTRCPCLRGEQEEVRVLDYRHCSLEYVPSDVFTYERTLEELSVDANQIRELPRELFYCHGLRKLNVSDNEIISVPPAVASLINLEELDMSKNGVVDLPENIKCCKCLSVLEASVNPLGRLPESFTQLLNLKELYLNDTFLDYLPGSFGRLSKLKILEVRENHLKTLPKSIARLTLLERLDIGNNEFTELPDVVGSLVSLLELWCDSNQISQLPQDIGSLKQLMFLDASKNRIETLPQEIEGCVSLADLHLSTNLLQQLPETMGRLSNLTTLKVDDNRLTKMPYSIGGLVSLSELNISANDLEELPPSIGLLRHLRTVYADENFLVDIPSEMGSCSGITVLSLRSNNLTYIPDEIGRIPRLRVLNLSDNKLRFLPFSFTRLKELQALWLAENQTKPLIRLQRELDPDTGQRTLTCYLLPQQPNDDREDMYSEVDSFHPSLWDEERLRRQQIHFDFGDQPLEESNLKRTPTPYPKEMKHRMQHMKNLALKQLNITPNEAANRTRDSGDGLAEPSRPVLGRRDSPEKTRSTSAPASQGLQVRNSPSAKPKSPLAGERHLILRADKEKMAKDKSRMHKEKPAERMSSLEEKSLSNNRGAEVSPTKSIDDDGGFLLSTAGGRRGQRSGSPANSQRSSREVDVYSTDGMPQYMSASQIIDSSMQRSVSNMSVPRERSSTDLAIEPNVTGISFTYSEFLNGLEGRGRRGNRTVGRSSNPYRDPNFQIPPSAAYHIHSAQKYSQPRHRHRHGNPQNNYGRSYGSEAGYKSETNSRSHGYDSDIGYRSDQEAVRRHRAMSGYSSDWNASVRSGPSNRSVGKEGYASDFESYSSRGRHTKTYKPAYQAHTHHSRSPKPPTLYSNIAVSKRTTIRNDELYEQQQKARAASNGSSTASIVPGQTSHRPASAKTANEQSEPDSLTTTSKSPQRSRPASAGHVQSPSPRNHQNPERTVTENSQNGEDEAWKEQLYQASVKLRKSPSDRRIREPSPQSVQSLSSQPPSSRPRRLTELEIGARSSTSSAAHHSVAGNESPTSVRSARSTGSARMSRTGSPPPHTDSAIVKNNRPTDLPINGHSNIRSRRQLKYADNPNAHTKDGQSEGLLMVSPGTRNSANDSQLVERQQQDGGQASDCHPNAISHSRSFPPGRSQMNGAANQGPGPPPNSQSTPLRLASYEKDIAMFKQMEPPSQVSSSTDSGYGHAHIYERVPVDSLSHSGTLPDSGLVTPGRDKTSHRNIPPIPPPPRGATPVGSYARDGTPPSRGYGSRAGTPGDPYSRDGAPAKLYSREEASVPPYSRESTPAKALSNQSLPLQGFNSGVKPNMIQVQISKNPGLGFSIAGGLGSAGNPFRPTDGGIFITKVQPDGPAAKTLSPADKILEVNGIDFLQVEHSRAVDVLRSSGKHVSMVIERLS